MNKDDKAHNAHILNVLLATNQVLYTKVRKFHWNVYGPHFLEYHKFFEELYEELYEQSDEIAERVRMLDEKPFASLNEYITHSFIKENDHEYTPHQMILSLHKDYMGMVTFLQKHIKILEHSHDYGNQDFFTQMLRSFEKRVWMLKSTGDS